MSTGNAGPSRLAVVVMGVSGSGKTTVGAALAGLLRLDFVDGDDLHPQSNVEKMHGGHPLTDEDRWPWLDRIGATLADAGAHPDGVIVACSALRRIYRDRIRAAVGPGLIFVFLDISHEEARQRMTARLHHFMPAALLDSQFATLESPQGEPDVLDITRFGNPSETARDAAAQIARHRGTEPPALADRPRI
jgi:gluconokinase